MSTAWVSVWGPKNVGTLAPRLGIGAWMTPETCFPHLYYCAKFGHSNVIVEKNVTRRAPPFKITQGRWHRHGLIGFNCDTSY